jgi:hypothetical protein
MRNRTNREFLLMALRRGASLLADFAYGIDAGSAIRHGLPAPPRRGKAASQRNAEGPTPPIRSTV